MSVHQFPIRPLGSRSAAGLALGASLLLACVCAQQPAPAVAIPPASHAPIITQVEPASGGILRRDEPIAVFRFTSTDVTDSIDARSFSISVDGVDRSALFHATRELAVGLLVPDSSADSSAFAPGVHQLHIRVCSLRGLCGDLNAAVTVIAAPPVEHAGSAAELDSTAAVASPVSLIQMLLELMLALARKLIAP